MTIRVLGPDELDLAASLLGDGEVLAIPTDTVYGLAAALGGHSTAARLAALKARPVRLPIAVLCASLDDARRLASVWPVAAGRLAAELWPGPLTIVVPATTDLAARVGSTGTVGLRVPADPTCQALLAKTGPLAVTSANLHDAAPATSAAQVQAAFEGSALAGVIDAGTRDGLVSSVVDVSTGEPVVAREGAHTREVLLAILTRA